MATRSSTLAPDLLRRMDAYWRAANYLPPDANCLPSVWNHCLRSRHYVNVVVAGKYQAPQWLAMDEAVVHCTQGLIATAKALAADDKGVMTRCLPRQFTVPGKLVRGLKCISPAMRCSRAEMIIRFKRRMRCSATSTIQRR